MSHLPKDQRMHPAAVSRLLESIQRRHLQGDCPTEPAQTIEMLEDLALELGKHILRALNDEPTAGPVESPACRTSNERLTFPEIRHRELAWVITTLREARKHGGVVMREQIDDLLAWATNRLTADLRSEITAVETSPECPACLAGREHDGPCEIAVAQRLATIALGAAGKHAERVVELEAEVSTLREHLAEVNRLLSLNVAEVERLRALEKTPRKCADCGAGPDAPGWSVSHDCTALGGSPLETSPNTASAVPQSPDRALEKVTRPYTADNGHSKGVAADSTDQALCQCGHWKRSHYIGSTEIAGPCGICSCMAFAEKASAKCGKLVEGSPCQHDAGHDGECDWVPY